MGTLILILLVVAAAPLAESTIDKCCTAESLFQDTISSSCKIEDKFCTSMGIFTGECGTDLDHDIVVVGYGTDSGNIKEKCGIAMEPIKDRGQNLPNPAGPSPATTVTFPQLKEQSDPPSDLHSCSKLVTILSIDGGGVRGIIPSVILAALETELQILGGKNVSIADYFQVMTGTIIAAKDLKDFYLRHLPNIFQTDSKLQYAPDPTLDTPPTSPSSENGDAFANDIPTMQQAQDQETKNGGEKEKGEKRKGKEIVAGV